MTQKSERRPGGGGAAADNAVTSDTKNSPPTAPAQGNPLLALVTELGGVLGGTWPGEIRRLMDVDRPLPLAIGIRDAIAAAVAQDARTRLGIILQRWTASTRYLRALSRPGALRHGSGARPRPETAPPSPAPRPEPAPAPRLAGNRARPMLRLGAR